MGYISSSEKSNSVKSDIPNKSQCTHNIYISIDNCNTKLDDKSDYNQHKQTGAEESKYSPTNISESDSTRVKDTVIENPGKCCPCKTSTSKKDTQKNTSDDDAGGIKEKYIESRKGGLLNNVYTNDNGNGGIKEKSIESRKGGLLNNVYTNDNGNGDTKEKVCSQENSVRGITNKLNTISDSLLKLAIVTEHNTIDSVKKDMQPLEEVSDDFLQLLSDVHTESSRILAN